MTILVSSLVAIIGAVAAIHIMWGIGFWFPIRDEERLVRAVVGAKDATRMPGPIPCGVVSAALIIVMFALISEHNLIRDIILGLAALFLALRGILSWVPMWRRMTPQEPFATLDRYAYGPLCLVISAGLFTVLLS